MLTTLILYLATETAVSRLSPVTMRHRREAALSSRITPADSGFKVFCITRKPRKVSSFSASSLVIFCTLRKFAWRVLPARATTRWPEFARVASCSLKFGGSDLGLQRGSSLSGAPLTRTMNWLLLSFFAITDILARLEVKENCLMIPISRASFQESSKSSDLGLTMVGII